MRRTSALASVLCCGMMTLAGCTGGKWTHFGAKMKLVPTRTIPVSRVLADTDKYAGKSVRVHGVVDSVCANRGCWMRLAGAGSDETLFVKFSCPVEGGLIPMEAAGRKAVVEGTLEVTEISQEEARHYQEDAGASPAAIAKIVGPQKEMLLRAPAAKIEGITTDTTATQ